MTILPLSLLLLGAMDSTASAMHFSHDDWTTVVSRFVNDRGLVDYEALALDRAVFDRYMAAVETTSPKSHPELFPSREEQLVYYINAYNALVFKGVLERGPEKDSVWRGGLISGFRFFVGSKIVIGGEQSNLKKLEDQTIRREFQDPRVHAALNCASLGCPRLPRKAFDPRHFDAELDAAMREFVGDAKHVRIDRAAQTVYLSKIFDWFAEDFVEDEKRRGNERPTLIDFVNRYRGDDARIPREFKIKFLPYDKGINAV